MKSLVLAALCAALLPVSARAAVLTFDDLPNAESPLADPPAPDGYGGFDYNNFFYLDPAQWAPIWNQTAAQSSPLVLVNGFGSPATMTRDTPFDLVSAYFANGINAVTITIDARDTIGGTVTHSATFATADTPSLQSFNWSGIEELDFSAVPTVDGTGHFSMDNFSYNVGPASAAPEPKAWALMILGFAGAGTMIRRRSQPRLELN